MAQFEHDDQKTNDAGCGCGCDCAAGKADAAQEAASGATYAAAGVDIERGERAVDLIKPLVESTRIPGVLGRWEGSPPSTRCRET